MRYKILEDILPFHCDQDMDILKGQQEYTNVHGIQRLVINTKGWGIQLNWMDKNTDWFPLYLIKKSNKIEMTEHAMARGHSNETALRCWLKRDRILNKVKSRCQKNRFKFGVEVPLTFEYALDIYLGKWQHTLA